MLYSPQDRYIQEFFIENANPSRELLESVYDLLVKRSEDPIELTADEIRELTNAPATAEAINSCLQILGRTPVMERLEMSGGLAMFRIDSKLPTLIDLLPKAANVQRNVLRTVEKAIADRREEAVYIHPRWLMQQLQMDRDALHRTLRELCKLDSFEYVPPFRGRAIHFRRRDVPFSELKIDHETLAARKKSDYEKLDRMVAYAQSRYCRQKTILEYFGDASASNCGICDRCQGKTGWPNMPKVLDGIAASTPTSTPSVTKAIVTSKPFESVKSTDPMSPSLLPSETKPAYDLIITILKAVERTHGYLSKTLLSQHLSGVESKAVQGLRLQRLAEFGILKTWKKSHSLGFLDQTLEVGLLCLSELRAGKWTVSISDAGRGCIAGTQQIPASLMQYVHQCILAAEKAANQIVPVPLKSHERTDPTPTNTVENIPITTFSAETKEIVSPSSEQPVRPIAHLPRADASDASSGRDVTAPMIEDWRWTVRLVEHGYRLGECALIRGKTPDSILDDLSKALQDGKRFTIEHLFDRRTQIAVKELRDNHDLQSIPPSIFQSYPSLWRFIQRWVEYDKR